ncbi:MAG: hypothetical protein V1732_04150 [Patescibacteria group bacterium]|nr:hypothetical protein [Patescibacteria group bacterium]MBU4141973.1 hypothetical protein [Patescibacteria group bacterium]
MSQSYINNLKTKKSLIRAIEAYRTVSVFSESELETLEILSNEKDKNLILRGIKESKSNKVHLIKSIL